MKKLVICSSVTFYPELAEVQRQFAELGLEVILPTMAEAMARAESEEDKQLLMQSETVSPEVKRNFIESYFAEIEKGDLILAYNQTKHDIPGYIGPNVLMELTVGFYLKKKLFVWQASSEQVHGAEELRAMEIINLGGDVNAITPYI